MGLFNSYLKDGPGVDVNAPKKKGIFLFLEVLGRKFFKLMKANCLYFLTSIPFFVIVMLILAPPLRSIFVSAETVGDNPMSQILFDLMFAGIIFNFIGSGPSAAAYSFVTRSFTRSEPVWVASDGFDKFKENFKYSMILVIADIVILFLSYVAVRFYGSNGSLFYVFLYFFLMIILAIYSMSHIFMYQIMVTYECKFMDIIKNAIILTFAKLPMCILLSAIGVVLCALIYSYLGFFGIAVYVLIGMSFTRFPLEFYASRVIEKNIALTQNSNQGDTE
ncbi:MAG: hypothetical protein PUF08_06860 [Clostridiales bacterium]|nr:hypothetical protein [Clostridiales bacterium]